MEIVHVAMVDMMIKYITMEMLCKVTPFIFAKYHRHKKDTFCSSQFIEYLGHDFVFHFVDLSEAEMERLSEGNEATRIKIRQLLESARVTREALEQVKKY